MRKPFTPEIAYILGMWHGKKLPDGIGIASEEKGDHFLDLIRSYLHPVEKVTLYKGKYPVFYHNRLENYLKKLEKDRWHRFRYHNDYSAAYFAGLFDITGSIVDGTVLLQGDRMDELLLSQLGFYPTKKEGFLIPRKPQAFLKYIENWRDLSPKPSQD